MVVPAETEFSQALAKPLEVIQSLYGKDDAEDFPARTKEYFGKVFPGRDELRKIPTLAAALSSSALKNSDPSGQLVRWRCMIQDTGLGTEMFLKNLNAAPESGYFGAADLLGSATATEGSSFTDYASLAERTVMFGVSVPAETDWHAEAWDQPNESLATATTNAYKFKLPLPEEKAALGALLKVYDAKIVEAIGVSDVIDVIGVLTFGPLPTSDWQSAGAPESSAAREPTDSIPCIHVISSQSVSLNEMPPALSSDPTLTPELRSEDQQQHDREELLAFLLSAVQGDRLVAELLLLALVARVHSTRAGAPIGALSLNICHNTVSAADSCKLAESIRDVIRQLCPAVVSQSLALSELNDAGKSFFPTSDGESLKAGRLQLPKGTVLLVDEGQMGEGELRDMGVRNIRALNSVISNRKLAYAFPFSEFEFESDLNVVVISQGKSFLQTDVRVPLRPSTTAAEGGASDARLKAWRTLILKSRRAAFDVTPETAELIQKEFVASRASTTSKHKLEQADLLRRMAMARLYSSSRGKQTLDMDSWAAVVRLDEECLDRLSAMPVRKEP